MSAQTSQFDTGHIPPVQQQQVPGWQKDMEQQPSTEYVPTPEGGYKLYEASGKLKNRKALITGGDSGIGKATAVLFAMEGADVLIQYLPEEEKDAQDTKAKVEKYGRKCYMYAANLKDKDNCVKMVEKAVNEMGGINILFNNHAYQMYRENILEVPDEQWLHTFDTNIHRKWPQSPDLTIRCYEVCLDTARLELTATITSLLLHLQSRSPTHEERGHHHQRRLCERLHRPSGPDRLHFHQRRNRGLHPRSVQSMGRERHPSQRHRSRTCVYPACGCHVPATCVRAVPGSYG